MSESTMRHLKKEDCLLMVVDIQERLLPSIHDHERVSRQSVKLIEGAKILGVPIVWTEQYKKGLGESTPEIREAIGTAAKPLEKLSFGCLSDEGIAAEVRRQNRKAVILCGIETHICVMQTAFSALDRGLTVALAEDAVSSRRPADHETGVARMRAAGVVPATVEMLFMEWMQVAGTDTFKRILPLLKS